MLDVEVEEWVQVDGYGRDEGKPYRESYIYTSKGCVICGID